jgi:acyl-coenzyme A synthetase/AMP-(fatty) acid ligase
MNVSALPFWQLERHGDAPAVSQENAPALSFRALAQLADDAASVLRPSQVFGLSACNTLACLGLYLGALRRGAVPLLLDKALDEHMRVSLLGHYGVGAWFEGKTGRWQGAIALDPGAAASPAVHPDLGLLLSTSGSIGSPKLVRLSLSNLAANAGSIVSYLGLHGAEVAITTLPLHYSYGLSVVNSHLACGANVVLTETAVTQAQFWALMRGHRVTSLSGVPTLWRMLRRLRFERMELPALHTFTQAGGRLEPEEISSLASVAQATGRKLFVMYGQTEATARMAYLPPERLTDKIGSVGVAIPGGELDLWNPQGQPLPAGPGEGQLVYRGPNVMLGYAETASDLQRGAEVDWLQTGDLARRDEDGYFWITGRLRRFIKLSGHRLNLDEIEQALRARGLLAGVTGRDDLLMVGVQGLAPEGCTQLARELASQFRCLNEAVRVLAVQEWPLGSNGKLQYSRLQAQLEARTGEGQPHG